MNFSYKSFAFIITFFVFISINGVPQIYYFFLDQKINSNTVFQNHEEIHKREKIPEQKNNIFLNSKVAFISGYLVGSGAGPSIFNFCRPYLWVGLCGFLKSIRWIYNFFKKKEEIKKEKECDACLSSV